MSPFWLKPFLQAGPTLSVLTGSHFLHTHTITSRPDGGPPYFASSGTNVETIEDSPIENPNTIGYSAVGTVGWDIPVFGVTFSPMATYELPLTTIRDQNQSDWKISSFYGSIALSFNVP